jgi:hypothetical protein
MLRHLLLTVGAATLLAAALAPDTALAHAHGSWHRAVHHRYLWGPDPRASRAGYYGPHYGRDCYRAASGRAICPFIHESL